MLPASYDMRVMRALRLLGGAIAAAGRSTGEPKPHLSHNATTDGSSSGWNVLISTVNRLVFDGDQEAATFGRGPTG